MKRFIYVLAAFIAVACSTNGYVVDGIVDNPDFDGSKIYCYQRVGNDVVMDSTIIENGKFRFTGELAMERECRMIFASVEQDREKSFTTSIPLEKGTKIKMVIGRDNEIKLSGNSNCDAMNIFLPKYKELGNKIIDARKSGDNEAFEAAYEEREKYTFEFVKENVNNPALWDMYLYNTSVVSTLEQKKELIAKADEVTKQSNVYKEISESIAILEKTAVGQRFTDFTMDDPDGNKVSLSDFAGKGKVVFVDFWASWCGPCRASIPFVKELYKKYGGEAFEIVGVSLDSKKEAWTNALKELDMPWPQMSDLKGWECEGAKLYSVSAIPHTLLLGADGQIVARNLEGEELEAKIKELLNK